MKKVYTILFVAALLLSACKNEAQQPEENVKPITKISFGSCSHQFIQYKTIFNTMLNEAPELHIAGGDNVYGDFFALAPGNRRLYQLSL